MTDNDNSGSEQQQVVYHLLSADDYWKALCSIKAIDQALSGLEEERIVGRGPQTDVAASLLDLLNDFEDKEFPEVWDDFETAVPSGADNEFRTIAEQLDDGLRTDGGTPTSPEVQAAAAARRAKRRLDKIPNTVLNGHAIGECPECGARFEYGDPGDDIQNLDPCPGCGHRRWYKWGYRYGDREIRRDEAWDRYDAPPTDENRPRDTGSEQCEKCGESPTGVTMWEGMDGYSCPECGHYNEFDDDLRADGGLPDPTTLPYSCPECGKRYGDVDQCRHCDADLVRITDHTSTGSDRDGGDSP